MTKEQFRCPRCGKIYKKREAVKLSIIYNEKEQYNPLPTGTKVTSYYKNVYFCNECKKQLHLNRIIRYTFAIVLPFLFFPIITSFTKGSFVSGIFPGIVTCLLSSVFLLPFGIIIYRKIKINTINQKYIKRARDGDAIV